MGEAGATTDAAGLTGLEELTRLAGFGRVGDRGADGFAAAAEEVAAPPGDELRIASKSIFSSAVPMTATTESTATMASAS